MPDFHQPDVFHQISSMETKPASGNLPENPIRIRRSVSLQDVDVLSKNGDADNNKTVHLSKLQNGPLKYLTNFDKSKSSSSTSLEFHAKPVPKCVKEPPRPIVKSFLKKTTTQVCIKEREPAKASYQVGLTKVVPFSFDDKIAEAKRKREKLLSEVFEKEKKAREFQAQPVPKKILKYNQGSKLQKSDRSQKSDLVGRVLKARPAKVLIQEPFIPHKSQKPVTEFVSYSSNSENRAAEREKFVQQLREKEEMIQQETEERRARELQLEIEEIAQIRKQAEHQAQPIRKYKKVKRITPKKLTDPVSP